ncbi:MAG TPA: hypothetical protein VGA37_07735 [Gemmatimonadales bacterium]
MRTRPFALVLATLAAGCGSADDPVDAVIAVASGTYEALAGSAPFPLGFPHEGASEFRMVVNRADGVVQISYVKAGSTVTEFWRIATTDNQ